ncbi:MAG: GNAT family N-acetyltransferase [Actinobacteria bacterium]|nr:GNAT family N-acetyltransferase [Actinomycetota bacterium]
MDFDRQPTLQGPKFRLRPLGAADRDAFIAVADDPLIWEEHPESDRATADKLERFFADSLASGGALAVTTADGAVVGSSRFERPDESGDRILVDHTFLARDYWTREDYTEVKALVFDHAFATFPTVELRVGVDNARTRGAVEDFLGATFVDTVTTPLGDHAVYELSREAWGGRG